MNEKEIIRRIKQGEKALFETLVKEYYQEIYHFCFYKTGDAESAYDCTQETFLHVIRRRWKAYRRKRRDTAGRKCGTAYRRH